MTEEQVLSPSVIVWYNLIVVKRTIYSDLNCHESGYEGKRLDSEKKRRECKRRKTHQQLLTSSTTVISTFRGGPINAPEEGQRRLKCTVYRPTVSGAVSCIVTSLSRVQ